MSLQPTTTDGQGGTWVATLTLFPSFFVSCSQAPFSYRPCAFVPRSSSFLLPSPVDGKGSKASSSISGISVEKQRFTVSTTGPESLTLAERRPPRYRVGGQTSLLRPPDTLSQKRAPRDREKCQTLYLISQTDLGRTPALVLVGCMRVSDRWTIRERHEQKQCDGADDGE